MPDCAWKIVIHGGAGVIERSRLSAEKEGRLRSALGRALGTGAAILADGGHAIDSVEAAVRELEDDPSFNAGRGAVFAFDGRIELEAAIMDGRDRSAGAVTGVSGTRHPVTLARAVMDHSPHVFLRGRGAEEFAREQGLEQVANEWFATDERRRQLDALKSGSTGPFDVDLKYGTVGAVALDVHGHVAAATSTGGLTGKRWGRIGDSPLIGAGTYADDGSAAISATGSGEYFIRALAAHQVAGRVSAGEPLQRALDSTLADIRSLGGKGGLIAVSVKGEMEWRFTTAGMYRARADCSGLKVALYCDEDER